MCVFMSSGSLSWLHKIELVISNISTPEGNGEIEREKGERERKRMRMNGGGKKGGLDE